MTLAAEQNWAPDRATEIAEEYRTNPHVRRGHRISSTVWGTVLLAEAALRIPLVYLVPIEVMVGLSTALMVATLGGLIMWNTRYVARAQRRAEDVEALA